MSAYSENQNTNKLRLSSNGSNEVKVEMNCYHGTTAGLSFISPKHSPYIEKGETAVIDTVESLKAKGMIAFICDADNYSGAAGSLEFIISEVGGNSITYRFPSDYDGTPDVAKDEDSPFLTFYCKFS